MQDTMVEGFTALIKQNNMISSQLNNITYCTKTLV